MLITCQQPNPPLSNIGLLSQTVPIVLLIFMLINLYFQFNIINSIQKLQYKIYIYIYILGRRLHGGQRTVVAIVAVAVVAVVVVGDTW